MASTPIAKDAAVRRGFLDQEPPPAPMPVSNDTDTDMVVAGRIIPAGETRHFDASLVPTALMPTPGEAEPPAPEPPPYDPLQMLQGESVNTIKAALPTLKDAQLEALAGMEEVAEKPRSTLLAALQEEHLRRAAADATEE